jgi:hypothetical protein
VQDLTATAASRVAVAGGSPDPVWQDGRAAPPTRDADEIFDRCVLRLIDGARG